MRTRLPEDGLIARLKAKPVTSSRLFLNGLPDPDGLLSPSIHGVTPKEKREVRAYINPTKPLMLKVLVLVLQGVVSA